MSENVDIVRAIYAGVDIAVPQVAYDPSVADLFAPSFELRPPEQSPDVQIYQGLDGMLVYLEMQLDVWDEVSFDTEQFLDRGDRVVVLGRFSVRGKGSGVPVTIPSAHVWTMRDGRVVCMKIYSDQSAALQAARLE